MRNTAVIALADSDAAIARCHPVMAQLRPHIAEGDFVARIRRQIASGYHLAALESAGSVRALAGFRFFECLAWGSICYVDDLGVNFQEVVPLVTV